MNKINIVWVLLFGFSFCTENIKKKAANTPSTPKETFGNTNTFGESTPLPQSIPVNIFFIRHGYSKGNSLQKISFVGHKFKTDPKLDPLGRKESKESGSHLAKYFLKHKACFSQPWIFISSSLLRSMETCFLMQQGLYKTLEQSELDQVKRKIIEEKSHKIIVMPFISETSWGKDNNPPELVRKQLGKLAERGIDSQSIDHRFVKSEKIKKCGNSLDDINQKFTPEAYQSDFIEFFNFLGKKLGGILEDYVSKEGSSSWQPGQPINLFIVTHSHLVAHSPLLGKKSNARKKPHNNGIIKTEGKVDLESGEFKINKIGSFHSPEENDKGVEIVFSGFSH